MEGLKGKVAVVTGASEGLGEAIVRRLAAEGMKVAALARRIDKLAVCGKGLVKDKARNRSARSILIDRGMNLILILDLENELKKDGLAVSGYVCDVQKESDVKDAFDKIDDDLGGVTILVNNAGTAQLVDLFDINLENSSAVLNTNVLGPLNCTREALASMKQHSINDGHIININSVLGHRTPLRDHTEVYAASKHALKVLTESLRTQIIKRKLKTRVSSISPGLMKTTMTDLLRKQRPDLPYLIADNIADAVMYAITAPRNVNITEMIIDPV